MLSLDEIVNEKKVAAAFNFLAGSDEQHAMLKTDMQKTEYLAKLAEAFAYKAISVGSVEDKKSEAKMSPTVQAAWDTHFNAMTAFEKLKAKRERAFVVIDMFRTLEASRRRGNV
jgi:hypothetical protein